MGERKSCKRTNCVVWKAIQGTERPNKAERQSQPEMHWNANNGRQSRALRGPTMLESPTSLKGSDSCKSRTRQSIEVLQVQADSQSEVCIPSHVLRVPSQNDVSASSRHVSGNGDCLAAPALGHNLRFPLHILRFGIQQLQHSPTFSGLAFSNCNIIQSQIPSPHSQVWHSATATQSHILRFGIQQLQHNPISDSNSTFSGLAFSNCNIIQFQISSPHSQVWHSATATQSDFRFPLHILRLGIQQLQHTSISELPSKLLSVLAFSNCNTIQH